MKRFNHAMKQFLKKIDNNEFDIDLFDEIIEVSKIKINAFHLYSLGLKYYSFLEREDDMYQDEDTHVCDHKHDHDYHHDHDMDFPISSKEEMVVEKKLCPEIIEVQQRVQEIILEFQETKTIPSIDDLSSLRKSLENQVFVLTAYGDQISLLENLYYKNRYKNETMVTMESDEVFARRVTEMLMSFEQAVDIREHLKYIYPELPMRIHKNKFLGLIDEYFEKLKGIPYEDLQNHIKVLKESFDPKAVEGYGIVASSIASDLEKIERTLIEGDEGEKDSAYHHMYHLTEDKNICLEKALDITEIINHLMGIALTFDEELMDINLYEKLDGLLSLETTESELAEVFKLVEEKYEPLGEAMLQIGMVIDRLSDHDYFDENEDLSHLFNQLQYAFNLSKDGYFIEWPYKKDRLVPSYKELMIIKNDVINTMEDRLNHDHRMLRRSRMSLMMGTLQIVHENGQSIYDHIYNSISSCHEVGEKVMSMQNIYSYLNDFIDGPYED